MVFLLLAGILISSGLLTYVMNDRSAAVLLSFERDRSSLLADDIARELKDAMLDKKPFIIKTLVTRHTMNADVKTALFRGDGTLYAGETDHRVPAEIFSDPRDMSITSEGRLIFYKPLLNEKACRQCHSQGKEILGIVMVDISSRKMASIISEIRSSMTFFTVSLAILGSLALILVLKRMVFSPLAALHAAAKKVGAGELQYRIDLPHKDEFGTVASAFNQMAGSIEKSRVTLEESVRQRTAELEEVANRYRESETRLKEAQRIAKMGNWKLDAENMTFWWSDETFKIFGKDPQAEPVSFSSFLESVHPEDREPLSRSVEHVIASGQTEWSYDYRIVLKGGEVRYIHAEGRAHLDESGIISERLGTVQDITERKKIEAALYTLLEEVSGKTDRDFFRSLVERLAKTLGMDFAYVGELTDDLNHVRAITFYARGQFQDNIEYALAGTPCNDVIGKELRVYPQDVQKLFPEDTMLVDMRAESYIGIPLFASPGKPLGIMAALSSRPMTDLKFVEFVFNMFAIRATSELERMQSDRLLKSQKEFSDAIFDSTTSGIMVLDEIGNVLKINRAGRELLERCTNEITGKNIIEICPETRPFLSVDHRLGQEILLMTSTGQSIPIGYSNSRLRNAQGTEEGVIVLFRDLSELKKLQASLKKKEHFETMGKVVSGVAHEVRNPLFGISSIGQILEREIETPQHRALISAMLKETARVKHLIEELLMYTRPSRLDIRPIDLNLLLMELEHHVNGKRPDVTVSIEAPLPVTISADRDKITQVFLNLFNNALEAARSTMKVRAIPAGDNTEVTIQDDGTGISPAHWDKIFEPFFTTKKGGTGLGLPICKKFVEDHDGTLDIQSTDGEGTTVRLKLKQ